MGEPFVSCLVYFARGAGVVLSYPAAFVVCEMFFCFKVADVGDKVLDHACAVILIAHYCPLPPGNGYLFTFLGGVFFVFVCIFVFIKQCE